MKQPSVKSNFLMNAILALTGILFPLITFPYVSRVLEPPGMGKVSLALSVMAYFTMFAQLGIPTYGVRECARVRDDREQLTRTVHELLGISLGMDVLAYALLALALVTVPRLGAERPLYLVVSCTVLLNSLGMEWLYKALEKYTYITLRSVFFKLLALAATFLLIRSQEDYVLYGAISVFAASASNLLNFIHAGKYISLRRPAHCDWRRHLKPVAIFFAMSCAATIYTNLDALMLGLMTTDADVGYYNSAVKVKGILVTLVTSLGAVLLPRSSYYVEQGRMEDFRHMTRKALHFVLLAASALGLYFLLFAGDSILLLSGEKYRESIVPMQIIMPTVLLIGLTNILGIQVLVPRGREKTVLWSEIAGAVVDLILNALLIPVWRSAGAAIGTLAAEAVVLAVQFGALRQELRGMVSGRFCLRVLTGLMIATAASLWLLALPMNAFPRLVCSALCFFGAYGLFLLWRRDEMVLELVRLGRRLLRSGKRARQSVSCGENRAGKH